jgi:hypothetical protein
VFGKLQVKSEACVVDVRREKHEQFGSGHGKTLVSVTSGMPARYGKIADSRRRMLIPE